MDVRAPSRIVPPTRRASTSSVASTGSASKKSAAKPKPRSSSAKRRQSDPGVPQVELLKRPSILRKPSLVDSSNGPSAGESTGKRRSVQFLLDVEKAFSPTESDLASSAASSELASSGRLLPLDASRVTPLSSPDVADRRSARFAARDEADRLSDAASGSNSDSDAEREPKQLPEAALSTKRGAQMPVRKLPREDESYDDDDDDDIGERFAIFAAPGDEDSASSPDISKRYPKLSIAGCRDNGMARVERRGSAQRQEPPRSSSSLAARLRAPPQDRVPDSNSSDGEPYGRSSSSQGPASRRQKPTSSSSDDDSDAEASVAPRCKRSSLSSLSDPVPVEQKPATPDFDTRPCVPDLAHVDVNPIGHPSSSSGASPIRSPRRGSSANPLIAAWVGRDANAALVTQLERHEDSASSIASPTRTIHDEDEILGIGQLDDEGALNDAARESKLSDDAATDALDSPLDSLRVAPVTEPPERPLAEAAAVEMSMKLTNVSYDDLTANVALVDSFTMCLKESIAANAGPGVQPEHVEVSLSAGSVVAQIKIRPPAGVPVTNIASKLLAEPISSNVLAKVRDLPGMAEISSGAIRVAMVDAPKVLRPGPQAYEEQVYEDDKLTPPSSAPESAPMDLEPVPLSQVSVTNGLGTLLDHSQSTSTSSHGNGEIDAPQVSPAIDAVFGMERFSDDGSVSSSARAPSTNSPPAPSDATTTAPADTGDEMTPSRSIDEALHGCFVRKTESSAIHNASSPEVTTELTDEASLALSPSDAGLDSLQHASGITSDSAMRLRAKLHALELQQSEVLYALESERDTHAKDIHRCLATVAELNLIHAEKLAKERQQHQDEVEALQSAVESLRYEKSAVDLTPIVPAAEASEPDDKEEPQVGQLCDAPPETRRTSIRRSLPADVTIEPQSPAVADATTTPLPPPSWCTTCTPLRGEDADEEPRSTTSAPSAHTAATAHGCPGLQSLAARLTLRMEELAEQAQFTNHVVEQSQHSSQQPPMSSRSCLRSGSLERLIHEVESDALQELERHSEFCFAFPSPHPEWPVKQNPALPAAGSGLHTARSSTVTSTHLHSARSGRGTSVESIGDTPFGSANMTHQVGSPRPSSCARGRPTSNTPAVVPRLMHLPPPGGARLASPVVAQMVVGQVLRSPTPPLKVGQTTPQLTALPAPANPQSPPPMFHATVLSPHRSTAVFGVQEVPVMRRISGGQHVPIAAAVTTVVPVLTVSRPRSVSQPRSATPVGAREQQPQRSASPSQARKTKTRMLQPPAILLPAPGVLQAFPGPAIAQWDLPQPQLVMSPLNAVSSRASPLRGSQPTPTSVASSFVSPGGAQWVGFAPLGSQGDSSTGSARQAPPSAARMQSAPGFGTTATVLPAPTVSWLQSPGAAQQWRQVPVAGSTRQDTSPRLTAIHLPSASTLPATIDVLVESASRSQGGDVAATTDGVQPRRLSTPRMARSSSAAGMPQPVVVDGTYLRQGLGRNYSSGALGYGNAVAMPSMPQPVPVQQQPMQLPNWRWPAPA